MPHEISTIRVSGHYWVMTYLMIVFFASEPSLRRNRRD
ncbi:MAG: hypothetical protein ACI9NC_005005, partial [Verrucomicrobiales bacterium]